MTSPSMDIMICFPLLHCNNPSISSLSSTHRTRVLLGLRAREIHVCGGMEACEIVRTLMKATGDDFEVVDYKRLSPLM